MSGISYQVPASPLEKYFKKLLDLEKLKEIKVKTKFNENSIFTYHIIEHTCICN